jgi:hypothetical protein
MSLIPSSPALGRGVRFFGVVDYVSYLDPKKCEQLVNNISNHITVKLYISEIPFQLYKEHMKRAFESKFMAKIQKVVW